MGWDIELPTIGFGTWPLKGKTCVQAVTAAAEMGYRLFDTATSYENFEAVGRALKPFNRENFYVISKVWHDDLTKKRLPKDLDETLRKLETDYLDAYLIHWPNHAVPIEETLEAMAKEQKEGRIRHLGVCNVTIHHMKRLVEVGIPITWVQNEMNPGFYDPEVLAFCHKHNIGVQAWGPLGQGRLHHDSLLTQISNKHGKSPSQISLRWILHHNVLPLPGSKMAAHIAENFDVLNFTLSQEEIDALNEQAQRGERQRLTSDWDFGFTDEFDFTYEKCWPKQTTQK